ncbi:MAG: hypothetical protein ACKOEE_17025 [Tagaea sp.]|jgi:hypothetical protein|nr:hypothetical protein [Azospirillum sp.]MCA3265228.1 hypothetical protein [Azospirillum sp.]
MREEIVEICAEALRDQGHPEATAEGILRDAVLARAAAGLLRDCRPMPVVLDLIAELDAIAGSGARA